MLFRKPLSLSSIPQKNSDNSTNAISQKRSRWSIFWRKLFRYVEHVFALIGLICMIYFLCFNVTVMSSPSMSPTLQGNNYDSGDWVLMEKVSYWFRNPKRWEVVAYRDAEGKQIMKRVVGLPGETVSLQDKWVQINGKPLPRPAHLGFLVYYCFGEMKDKGSMECGNGYFVLGDYAVDSYDSRYEGPLDPKRIIGRAWMIVWPKNRICFIK